MIFRPPRFPENSRNFSESDSQRNRFQCWCLARQEAAKLSRITFLQSSRGISFYFVHGKCVYIIPFLYSRGTGRMIPDEKSLKMIPSEFRYHFLDEKMILGKNNTLRGKTLKKWYRQSSGTIFEQPRLEYSEISDVEKAYNFHFWHGFHCIFRCFSKKSPTASELIIIFVFSWYHWTSLLLWNSRLTCP